MSNQKKLHRLLVSYLANETAYGRVSTPGQLNAAAKQIARSGSLPASVARRLGLV